jgi:hypothetical protein
VPAAHIEDALHRPRVFGRRLQGNPEHAHPGKRDGQGSDNKEYFTFGHTVGFNAKGGFSLFLPQECDMGHWSGPS